MSDAVQIPGPNRMLHLHVEEDGKLVPYPATVIRCNEKEQTVDVCATDYDGSHVLRDVPVVARNEARPYSCTWPPREHPRYFPAKETQPCGS